MELDKKILLFSGLTIGDFNRIVQMLRDKDFEFDADRNPDSEFSLDDIYLVATVHMLITRLFYPAEKAVETIASNLLDKDTLMFLVDRYISYSGVRSGVLEEIKDSERD